VSELASVVGVSSGDKDVCISTCADGTVGLLSICFGYISGQNFAINVNINHI